MFVTRCVECNHEELTVNPECLCKCHTPAPQPSQMGRYALLDRIAVLEAQLAETTQQRDFAREVLAYASGKREQDWAEGVIGTAETLVGAILYQHNSSL